MIQKPFIDHLLDRASEDSILGERPGAGLGDVGGSIVGAMAAVKPAYSISRPGHLPCGDTVPTRANLSYADALRALGQALETQSLVSFELEEKSGDFLVRGLARLPQERQRTLFVRIESLLGSSLAGKNGRGDQVSEVLYQFPPERIQQLHREGRKRRVNRNRTPDPTRLSQVLRSAGCYLDNKVGIFLSEIAVDERWLTLSYVTPEGRIEQTKAALDFFYDYWIKMYLRRRELTVAPPPGK